MKHSETIMIKRKIEKDEKTKKTVSKSVLVSVFLTKQEEKLFDDVVLNNMGKEKALVCNLK